MVVFRWSRERLRIDLTAGLRRLGMTTLKDQVALLTGASSGIGSATVLLLATKGVKLWLTGRNRAKLDVVAESALRTTSETFCIQADLERDTDHIALAARLQQNV